MALPSDELPPVPRVSFVIASYNHERYIGATLDSILDQTIQDFEIVVVDDGSRDGTLSVAEDYARRDPRIRAFGQENRGVVAARNRGTEMTRAPYVSIVDSDDLLPRQRTEWQVEALDANPEASMVYGNAEAIDDDERRLGTHFDNYPPVEGDFASELFANYCFVPAISVMFRKEAWRRSGPFWGPGPNTDYLKWIELGLVGPAICLRDRELGRWRRHGNNTSMAAAPRRAEQYEETRRGLEQLLERHPVLAERLGERRVQSRYARCHQMAAFYAGLESNWSLAREQFRKAQAVNPSLTNTAGVLSTIAPIRWLSPLAYEAAARRYLKVRR
ncbi:MAG: glycosyltransferase [Sumerlaeia bacterium]